MEEEYQALLQTEWFTTNRIFEIPHNAIVIGRYSVLPFYSDLEEELKLIYSRFINSYEQHRYIADIENWYQDLKEYTPQTWFEWSNLPEGQFIVKGRTNSRKFQWSRQMFCASRELVPTIVASLLDDSLIRDQGVCVRSYVPLRQFDTGINGLPITNEWRVFCLGTKTVIGDYYWSNFPEHKPYSWEELPQEALDLLEKVKAIVAKRTNFYVIDIAETKEGNWIVIELNDGQMSGLSDIDPTKFYNNLYGMTGVNCGL